MSFRLRHGDIVEAETDAIVNAWNRNFIPYWLLLPQGVAGALRREAGREPFREVSSEGLLELGEVVATSAGSLDNDYILHAAALHWYWSSSERAVRLAAENLFDLCASLDISDVAVPLLGAGTGGLSPEESLALIHRAWEQSGEPLDTETWVVANDLADRLADRPEFEQEAGSSS